LLQRFTRRAADEGAQLVVAPEGFLEGYVWNDDNPKDFSRRRYVEVGETFDSPFMGRVAELAKASGVYLSVGYAERRGDDMFNSVIVYSPAGDVVSRYSKSHTAGDEPFNTKGSDFPVADTALGRWGTLICFDRQLPETSRILAVKGAQLIMVPSWGMYGEINDVMMRTRAFENGLHIAFVHPKRVLIIGPDGAVIAEDSEEGDEIVSAHITLQPAGERGPIRRRRPELYRELVESEGRDEAGPVS
jgi:predicted amidohydrolase